MGSDRSAESVELTIEGLVRDYAQSPPAERPWPAGLSLRHEIGLDSFSLVSLMLRLGEEFEVDFAEESERLGINLQDIATFGDLVRIGTILSDASH